MNKPQEHFNHLLNKTYIHYLPETEGNIALFELLNEKEQERVNAFRFEEQRDLYIKAHIFLRQTLSSHAGISPKEWQFSTNNFGKPFISNPKFQSLQFNLSHTKGMIVCAISMQAVGIDVEGIKPINYLKQICQKHFTPDEYNDIFSMPCEETQLHRFYTYWTLKEAFVKAIGCGLSIPLKKVGFEKHKNNGWILSNNVELPTNVTRSNWLFLNHKLSKKYQLSIATAPDSEIIICHSTKL